MRRMQNATVTPNTVCHERATLRSHCTSSSTNQQESVTLCQTYSLSMLNYRFSILIMQTPAAFLNASLSYCSSPKQSRWSIALYRDVTISVKMISGLGCCRINMDWYFYVVFLWSIISFTEKTGYSHILYERGFKN